MSRNEYLYLDISSYKSGDYIYLEISSYCSYSSDFYIEYKESYYSDPTSYSFSYAYPYSYTLSSSSSSGYNYSYTFYFKIKISNRENFLIITTSYSD